MLKHEWLNDWTFIAAIALAVVAFGVLAVSI